MSTHHSVSKGLFRSILLAAIILAATSAASASQPDLRQQIDSLTTATSLDRAGVQPWHMRLAFDLFDLKGNPQESGTVEEWWAAPDRARIVITSPSFNETLPGTPVTNGREAYLVHLLLQETVHPMFKVSNPGSVIPTVVSQTFGQIPLSCTTIRMNSDDTEPRKYCTDPRTGDLRLLFTDGIRSDALNEISPALNAQVGMRHTIAYMGQVAIKGHVESIERFDPGLSNLTLGPVTPSQDGLTQPRLLTRISPIYPSRARESDQSGFAVLRYHILPNGRVSPIDIVASTGSAFVDASTDAVRRWRYNPAKRNGAPLECDSTLTVIFSPPGSNQGSFNVNLNEQIFPE